MGEPQFELRTGLGAADLAAIAELERVSVAADGGRLKLEWGTLATRKPDETNDVVCLQDGVLVGFLGVYAFGPGQAELAGMVHPAHRRRGIGSGLLRAALPLVAGRGQPSALLVCPHTDAAAGFARAHGGTFDHGEYAMLLSGPPSDGPSNPAVTLRAGSVADAAVIARLLEAGFGHPPGDVAEQMSGDGADHVVVEHDGRPVGYLRTTLDGDRGGVYGFVIDPAWQGRGIGRDVLRRCCRDLATRGAAAVGLEVAVENERALGLYTSIGFEQVTTEDYFRLTSSPA